MGAGAPVRPSTDGRIDAATAQAISDRIDDREFANMLSPLFNIAEPEIDSQTETSDLASRHRHRQVHRIRHLINK